MRYQPTHAAPRDSVPFVLRGPKSLRTALAAAVAGAIGLTPAFMLTSPAQAAIAGYSISPSSIQTSEGRNLVYTVTRTGGSALLADTLYWSIGEDSDDDTVDADEDDFDEVSGVLEFPADDTTPFPNQTARITVALTDDSLFEDTESFELTISDTATIGQNSHTDSVTGGIVDNDEAPGYRLVFDDATPDESAETVLVSAELLAPSGKEVTIPISTKDGTAIEPRDYEEPDSSNDELTIPAGSTESAPVEIAIVDDETYEDKEQSFTVTGGSDPSVTGTQTGTVTIQDDDAQPEITVAANAVDEGEDLEFGVTLSGPSEREVTARWDTADGRGSDLAAADAEDHGVARAGSDYTAVANGTVKFPAATDLQADIPDASTAQTITVRTRPDSIDELSPEDMHVTLSSPSAAATLGDANEATGGINDDAADVPPTATVQATGTTVTESNTRKTQTYTVRLSGASGKRVTVDYSTVDGTALEGRDYAAVYGTLTFEPGEVSKTFTVDIVGDTAYEDGDHQTVGKQAETFEIDLNSSTATTGANATVTITDDDAMPSYTVAPMTMGEGNTGSVAVFPVKLSNPTDVDVEFTVTAGDITGTATADSSDPGGADYIVPGSVTIPAGQTTGYLYFLVNGDEIFEGTETVGVPLEPQGNNLLQASNITKDAVLTITNDDAAPSLTVLPMSVSEDDEVQLRGVVAGVAQANTVLAVTAKGASVSGSRAASADDFTDPGTMIVTIPGDTFPGTSVPVGDPLPIIDDTTAEPAETIVVSGSASGGSGTVKDGVITIAASDGGTTPTEPGDPDSVALSGPAYRVGPGAVRLTGSTDPNTEVQLWSAPYNGDDDAWSEDGASTMSSSTGAFVFNRTLTTAGRKYVVHAGETVSDEVQVALRQAPALAASSASRGIVQMRVSGGVPGAKFLIQRQNGSSWSTVFSDNLKSTGTYNKALTGQPSGRTVAYRVYVYGNTGNGVQSGISAIRRVAVR